MVELRLDREQSLSFLEFNYMILQAYDFRELAMRAGCRLQLGGSDQWGNIVNGIELTRRMDGVEVYGVTTPLVTTAEGAKMGKTAAGAVWLNADQLSPYDYWQFWRNTADADVVRFLKLFTDLPLDRIAELEQLEAPRSRRQIVLANQRPPSPRRDAAATPKRTAPTPSPGGAGDTCRPFRSTGESSRPPSLTALGFAALAREARRKIVDARAGDGVVVREPALVVTVMGR